MEEFGLCGRVQLDRADLHNAVAQRVRSRSLEIDEDERAQQAKPARQLASLRLQRAEPLREPRGPVIVRRNALDGGMLLSVGHNAEMAAVTVSEDLREV